MPQLLFTLIGEGPSDDALIPIVQWVLESPTLGLLPSVDIVSRFVSPEDAADVGGLVERMIVDVEDFPCSLLFVHHDADGPTHTIWADAIREASLQARHRYVSLPPCLPVVPVPEMEAWLLIDEMAIRRAARNPHGTARLNLPRTREIEACLDPKEVLREALRTASGLTRRRWAQVDIIRPRTVADRVHDFSLLRQLAAFQAFEADVRRVVVEQKWPERL
jgi:hypothetical protein